jgi:DNA-binding transcriptional LysR family regulator
MRIVQQSSLPNTEALMTFLAVARRGSFVAAADELGCDATVVSRRIQALESRLGVVLFHRTTRRVALTEAGTVYQARLDPLLWQLDEAGREVAGFAGGEPRGVLRVALPGTFGRMRIAPHLPAFLARYPGVRLQASFSNRFVDLIAEGFDLAVRLGVAPDTRLAVRQVGQRRRLLCASPDYLARCGAPASIDALGERDCLIFSGVPQPGHWVFERDGQTRSVAVTGRMVSDEAEALREAALAGLGILYAADWLVEDAIAAGKLVPLLTDWRLADEGAIHVITPAMRWVPGKTRAFAEWVAALLRR